MRLYKIIVITTGLLSLLLAGSLPAQTEPVFQPQAEKKLPWKRLSFAAKKVLGKVTTEIQWENLTVEKNKDLLIPVPMEGALQSTGCRIFRLEGRSVVKPLWGSEEVLKTHAWYDPGSMAVLQRTRWRQGKERWEKIYRFTDQGVYRLRKQPANSDEYKQPPSGWTDTLGSYYGYGANDANCSQILEPLVLLYVASTADRLTADSPVRLCVFGKKQLHRVEIRNGGVEHVAVDYTQQQNKIRAHKKGKIEAVKYSFNTSSLAGNHELAEPFSFMGLKGDFDIFIEPITRIPIQVSGQIPPIGSVTLALIEVQLN